MEKQRQNIRSWDDLIFENRNKAYGAYALRQDYSNTLLKGLLTCIGFAVAVLVVAELSKGRTVIHEVVDKSISFTPDNPPTIKPDILPQKPRTQPPRQISRNLPPAPVVTPGPVEPTPEPATTAAGTEGTTDGTVTTDTGTSGSVDTGTDLEIVPVKNTEPFIHVEVMPKYKGGLEGMMKTLKKNMRYPASARRMGREGTVHVEFVVNVFGEITDVKVLRGFDLDCDKEAVRMVQKLTEWTPGFQNKSAVNVKMVLPVKFRLEQ